MGWELRKDRWYLYRNARANGRPRKEYLAAEGDYGSVMAHELHARQGRDARRREATKAGGQEFRRDVDALLADVAAANAILRTVVEGALVAVGFRNHHRGEWRKKRDNGLSRLLAGFQGEAPKPSPMVNFVAPADDPEALAVFAKARGGDIAAAVAVRKLIADRQWTEHMGNVSTTATRQLVARCTTGDEVWTAAVNEKLAAMSADLGGSTGTMLEKLLIRRVLNGWLAVHTLEIQQSVRPPAAVREREHLDRALSRAQRRYTEAITALARIRRLNVPLVLAQVNVMGPPAAALGTSSASRQEATGKVSPQNNL